MNTLANGFVQDEVELPHLLYMTSLREAGRHAEAAAAGAEIAARFGPGSAVHELLEVAEPEAAGTPEPP